MANGLRRGQRKGDVMSTNCIHCLYEKRTGIDLLCDACRINRHGPTTPEHAIRDAEFFADIAKRILCKEPLYVSDTLEIAKDYLAKSMRLSIATRKLKDIAYFHGHKDGECCDADCGECGICAVLDCPHGDPLHYHHDGCPSCYAPKTDSGGPV